MTSKKKVRGDMKITEELACKTMSGTRAPGKIKSAERFSYETMLYSRLVVVILSA
jgi:hypothetical protein